MAVVSKDTSGTYPQYWFSFSKTDKTCFLYLCDFGGVHVKVPQEIFKIDSIAGTNIERIQSFKDSEIWLNPKIGKKGSAVFTVSLCSIRNSINQSSAYTEAPPHLFEEYLGESKDLDVSSSTVQRVSREILGTLAEENRTSYGKAQAIFSWVKQNISYSVVQKKTIEAVASWIHYLPAEKRRNASSILCASLRYRQDHLQNIGNKITVPSHITTSFEVAKYVLEEFNSAWSILQLGWIGETSASQTIKDGMGKCVGIANTFVALCRSMGIPARTVVSNVKTNTGEGGSHQWAIIYLAPYGWLEVDPTCGRFFEDFPCEYYQYKFLNTGFNGEVDITSRERVTR